MEEGVGFGTTVLGSKPTCGSHGCQLGPVSFPEPVFFHLKGGAKTVAHFLGWGKDGVG